MIHIPLSLLHAYVHTYVGFHMHTLMQLYMFACSLPEQMLSALHTCGDASGFPVPLLRRSLLLSHPPLGNIIEGVGHNISMGLLLPGD